MLPRKGADADLSLCQPWLKRSICEQLGVCLGTRVRRLSDVQQDSSLALSSRPEVVVGDHSLGYARKRGSGCG